MKENYPKWIAIASALIVASIACNTPLTKTPTLPQDQTGEIHTQAAATLNIELTRIAQAATQTATLASPHINSTPTNPPAPTTSPLASPTPTVIPPTNTTIPPTPVPLPCLAVEFLRDVTIPDNTKLAPGTGFTKTWRLRNAGSCTWTRDFELVFHNGDRMDASKRVPLTKEIESGEKLTISVDMIAPALPGTYQGYWMLADSSGKKFGLGDNANKPFWVLIKVKEVSSGVVYSFVDQYCHAEWNSGSGTLPCPGKGTEPSGFVLRQANPNLENRKENEPAIWTNPEMVDDGWITGTYPPIKIKAGDRFIADVGCLAGSNLCDVLFQLRYRIGEGTVKDFGEWHEIFDGNITNLDLDLSSLADQEVQFILTVRANGSYKEDAAFWLQPRVER